MKDINQIIGEMKKNNKKSDSELLNKFLGVMVGGAVGDALGAPVEFLPIDSFYWVDDYIESPNLLDEGERTDDTAMALLLADSLIRCKGFDIEDQLRNYYKWHKTGHMGLKNYPEGEGMQVSKMMYFYEMYLNGKFTDKPWETDLSGEYMDGNGSLMRIGPIPLFYYDNPEEALFYAGESSKSTHHTDLCIASCIFYTGLILGAMNGVSKEELLKPYYSPIKDYRKEHNIPDALNLIFRGSYKEKDRYEIKPSGYVVETLEAALWGFYNAEDFKDGMEKVVNLGGDADTIGCIYGYLAGAYYGYDNIPQEWKDGLIMRDKIEKIAKKLYDFGISSSENKISSKYDLYRFKSAQENFFDTALREIRNGHKETHWIWYIFPQIAGLGRSEIAQKYAISCKEEAIEYYNDKDLRKNLEMISQALLDLDGNDPELILGGIDAMKVKSCMTLFHKVDPKNQIFKDVLDKYYNGELDEMTLDILGE